MSKYIILVILIINCVAGNAQQLLSDTLKVHFLHGSRPKAKYKHVQPRWFGGKFGGHAGIQINNDSLIDFYYRPPLHIWPKPLHKYSTFARHSYTGFYTVFGGSADSHKITIISIPISPAQKLQLITATQGYLANTPYDYAFMGMRCGAATYDMLSKANIVTPLPQWRMVAKIFYPRLLRKKLLLMAKQNDWNVARQSGCATRLWE
jgi:hypothetical protein